jgi:2'-5' RNA ligase
MPVKMKRTFIAIKIQPGEELIFLMEELRDRLKNSRIKWVETENIHITLAFIGNTSENDIESIKHILESACTRHNPIPLVFQGIGLFRSVKDPKVIFLQVMPPDALDKLRDDICKRLSDKGLFNDSRPFNPHLTIGRPKYIEEKNALPELISAYRDINIQSTVIDKVTFYESMLTQNGPIYKVIGDYEL